LPICGGETLVGAAFIWMGFGLLAAVVLGVLLGFGPNVLMAWRRYPRKDAIRATVWLVVGLVCWELGAFLAAAILGRS
jgi:hypothetical protein